MYWSWKWDRANYGKQICVGRPENRAGCMQLSRFCIFIILHSTGGFVTISCNVHWFPEMPLCSEIFQQDIWPFLIFSQILLPDSCSVSPWIYFIILIKCSIFGGKKVCLLSNINAMVIHFPQGPLNVSGIHVGDYSLVFDLCNIA